MDKDYYFKLNEKFPDGTDPKNPIRIFTDGVFDCLHIGHCRLFERIKKLFPHVYLIVGVSRDDDITKEKAEPLINEDQRLEMVSHIKWVDQAVFCPWISNLEFMDSIGAHYCAHDKEPYPFGDIKDVYQGIKEANRFIATTRTEGISTTDVIGKVLKNYDVYVQRSLKKGITPEELGLKK